MQIIETIALITINETLFAQLISFLIFLFIMNRIMFRPLRNTMIGRDMYLAQTKHDIVNAEKEMEKVSSQLKSQEEKVRKEANHIREQIELAGSTDAEKIFESARKEIVKLRENSREAISAQIEEARKDLVKESEAIALTIMEKVLNRRVS